MPQVQQLFAEVASGDQVSGDIALIGAKAMGLHVPGIDSAEIFLQANYGSQASADFVRLLNPAGSGDFTITVDSGVARSVDVTDVLGAFPHARIELGAAQTDTRTFALAVKIL